MIVLGLTIGELSTAAIMVDGVVVAAAHEERFSRLKNDERYPMQAIDYCLKAAGITGKEIDEVAIAGLTLAFGPWVTRTYSTFSLKDHIRAQKKYWYPRLYEGKSPLWTEVFKDKLDLAQYPGGFEKLLTKGDSYYAEENWPLLRDALYAGIERHLGVPKKRIKHYEHHSCHAAYAYWGSPYRDGETLVLTLDAYGDGLSATVNRASGGAIERVHQVPDSVFRLARLYRYVTLVLGMKPNEHEYKVMGLAAYAKPEILKEPYELFKDTMFVDGLDFGWKTNPKDMYFWFREQLEGYRFDGIAGGLQKYLEDILAQWVGNVVTATGLRRLVVSGGIAMNVKAHKVLHEMDAIEDIFVPGSGSDESLAVGACYKAMENYCRTEGMDACSRILPHSMYLGTEFTGVNIRTWVRERNLHERYEVQEGVGPDEAAAYLAKGNVIGRMAGRMEFGQRALGNRSIIADPRNKAMIDKINWKIKNRDFWMPFAPSILAEDADRYLVNPKGLAAPHMTVAFDASDEAKRDLEATLHPADKTMRPQVVTREANPGYHALLSAFKAANGVGGVLNTSFNLHGEPIVHGPEDALHVFENSHIDMILLEDVLIRRKGAEG